MQVNYSQVNFSKQVNGYTVDQVVESMKNRYPELNAANTYTYNSETDTLDFRFPAGTKN